MPDSVVVRRFVDTVEAGDFTGAIERFYLPDAYMQENQAEPRVGRARLVAEEAAIMASAKQITARCLGAPLIEGDRVAIRWQFQFTFPDGRGFTQEEVAWQTWRGAAIAEETFFYDPAQQAPR